MDHTINRAILFGTHPPRGIYFVVRVEYNHDHPIYGGKMPAGESLLSSPIGSFPEAMDISEQITMQLQQEKFMESEVVEVDPDETDGFHYYISDTQQVPVARVGIDTYDIRNQTFH